MPPRFGGSLNHTQWAPGADPADTLHRQGPAGVAAALHTARPLANTLTDQRLAQLPEQDAIPAAIEIIAAQPGNQWNSQVKNLAARTGTDPEHLRRHLLPHVRRWTVDPSETATHALRNLQQVKARLAATAPADPAERWRPVADQTDPRLTAQSDWPALAAIMQTAHDHGLNVATTVRDLTIKRPLNQHPAQDLRYRLLSQINPPPEPTLPVQTALKPVPRPPRNPRGTPQRPPALSR